MKKYSIYLSFILLLKRTILSLNFPVLKFERSIEFKDSQLENILLITITFVVSKLNI